MRLAVRLALYVSIVLFLTALATGIPLFGPIQGGSIALGVLVSSFASVYLIAGFLVRKRILKLRADLANIYSKRFEEIGLGYVQQRDEIDELIRLTITTGETVEKEIHRLKKMENYRKEFIGDVSHELKTPIFAIQGFIETLLNGALEDKEVNYHFLQKAMKNVNRLIILTNDLMEISKLETGELKIEPTAFELKTVIHEVSESLQYKSTRENVDLQILMHEDPLHVFADRDQVRQLVNNLVENAIKYNKPGGKVTLGTKAYPKNPNKILLFVRDTGIGIPDKHMNRLTERFYRVDKSRSREKGGTGLGLAIVKHIVEAHDEILMIDSTPQVGSTFSFTLTLADRVTA